jgi:hypothetical protein
LAPLQNGELLGMAGKGTPGGQLRVDGSEIEAGVHLRWQMAQELGFPPLGFDVYRRDENYRQFLHCGSFREADIVGVAWLPYNQEDYDLGFAITFTGEVRLIHACQQDNSYSAAFPGEQEVRLDFTKPVRYVRITFDERTTPNPVAEAYWHSSAGEVLMERQRAHLQNGSRQITLFADRIDSLLLQGENMVICEVCFVLISDGFLRGWPQVPLNGGAPIYLPITHPDWHSPHPHTPDDQAEAESRLPTALPEPKQDAYAQGFQDELHPILYDLVGTDPQNLFRLNEGDLDSAATLDWPGLSLLQLMAIDPNIARILGLYWHDEPPLANKFYDYRLIAHYGDNPFPGKQVHFSDLEPGIRCGTFYENQGLAYISPNPIDVVRASWDGSEQTGLLFTREIPAGPISVALPEPVKSVTLRFSAATAVTVKYFLGYKLQHSEVHPAGEITAAYDDPDGIHKILLLTFGELTLFEVALRQTIGGMGDLIYDVYHVRTNTSPEEFVPEMEPPVVAATATGLDENGEFVQNQSQVDLRWERLEAGGVFLRAGAPVLYHVQRSDLAEDGETVVQTAILNEEAPTLISERHETEAPLYSDRSVPDGTYTYAVRGIDIFGVLGDWSQAVEIEVQDHRAPPPPQSVQAQVLDPADPWLSQEDQDWVLANGPGLKLAWSWPGIFRLQAPDVMPPQSEFRVYGVIGALNRLDGLVSQVTTRAGISALATDINWSGAADALAGESIRINQNFFQVTSNTQGPNCIIAVRNLTAPDLAPAPGPCSLSFSRERSYWRDYGRAANWQQRLHVEPVQDIPLVLAEVLAVADFDTAGEPAPILLQPGATRTVTLDQGLDDPEGILIPGVLLCDGLVYPAYGHTLGEGLQIHFVPVVSPADSSLLIEPAVGAACTYYPGRHYEVRIPGFELPITAGQAIAFGQIAMSTSDGQPYIADDPVWSRRGRGGLGGRAGNESVLSPVVTIQTVQRTPPAAVANVPQAPDEPIFAQPANYYGQARYTLAWEMVPDVEGFAIYRCSGAALFDQDRTLRQGQKAPYDSGSVFADDEGFSAWLSGFDPSLTEAELVTHPDDHLDAWRAWSRRFYPQLSDVQVQELGSLTGNQAAFRRLNQETVQEATYEDTFDGRGQGIYLYRLRTLDTAGNLSEWSPAFPPVHIFDVTPPATPVVTSVSGGEKFVALRWRANRENDLSEYWVWRDQDTDALLDVRRRPATAVVQANGEPTVIYVDEGLDGLQTYYYRLAAVDTNGNVSEPTRLLSARVADSFPPNPPVWERWEWVRLDADGNEYAYDDPAAQGFPAAIALAWLADQLVAEATLERRSQYDQVWAAVATLLEPVDASDPESENARRFAYDDQAVSTSLRHTYRVRLKDKVGKINTRAFNEVTVSPPVAS